MEEVWRPGGSIIEENGIKILELRGIRIVGMKPVKAVVRYSVAELEEFLYRFIPELERDIKSVGPMSDCYPAEVKRPISNPSELIFLSSVDKAILDKKVQDVISFLTERKRVSMIEDTNLVDIEIYRNCYLLGLVHLNVKVPAFIIISSAFEFDFCIGYTKFLYIPPRVNKNVPVPSPCSITLPEDILHKEILAKMYSLRFSAMRRMVAKSVQHRFYEYEHLIPSIPEQSLITLSKLYSGEKDPEYKEHLFTLALKAYSMIPVKMCSDDDFRMFLDKDILVTLASFNIQTKVVDGVFRGAAEFLEYSIEAASLFFEEGLLGVNDISIDLLLENITTIPDNCIDFIDRWLEKRNKELTVQDISTQKIPLYDDLKSGRFSKLYKCEIMLEAIKKGYVKEPYKMKRDDGYREFILTLQKCSEEDHDLLRKFIEPNPLIDYFLSGIRPTVKSIFDLYSNPEAPDNIIDYISLGLTFSDTDVNYRAMINRLVEIADEDTIIIEANDNNILPLKELGDSCFLALSDGSSDTSVAILRRVEDFFLEEFRLPLDRILIEYLANATEEDLNSIITFYRRIGSYIFFDEIVDDSITDLEMYSRFMINAKAIKKIVVKCHK